MIAGVSAGIILSGVCGCVTVDTRLGQDLMPLEQQYDVYTAEWKLNQVGMKPMDYMSGYSSRRITIGTVSDPLFGTIRKGSAFTLVPAADTLDFGTDPVVREFHIALKKDTTNTIREDQLAILQNVNVYSMEGLDVRIDSLSYIDELKRSMFDGAARISVGVPVYDGGDSLSFNFTRSFADKMLQTFLDNLDEEKGVYIFDTSATFITEYITKFPGIYLCTDDPVGYGGRFDMFDVAMGVSDSYATGNCAELKFTSTYDGEKKDTSMLFLFGAVEAPNGTVLPDQYAFNATEIENGIAETDAAAEVIYVEGGNGVKPVLSAKEIYGLITAEIDAKCPSGVTRDRVIINKASVKMPFEFPADYKYMEAFPQTLSPCCKVRGYADGKKVYTYANLTDASISAESHGEIDRSNLNYTADFSFHAQKMLTLTEPHDTTLSNYDVWFLINYTEINESSSSSSSDSYSDYLNQLYYYNYLNQLYGGYGGYGYGGYGYGSYGGYGGYGYNNYYSMMMYSSLYGSSSSSSTAEESVELDRDRFYGAMLCGRESGNGPTLTLTYSVPKRDSSL